MTLLLHDFLMEETNLAVASLHLQESFFAGVRVEMPLHNIIFGEMVTAMKIFGDQSILKKIDDQSDYILCLFVTSV